MKQATGNDILISWQKNTESGWNTALFVVKRGWRAYSWHDRGRTLSNNSEAGLRVQHSFAKQFYTSWPWIKCSRGYAAEKNHLCERCLAKGLIVPGVEVHHKIRLTPENLNNPEIALNFDNLELLCKNCHMEEHRGTRWRADERGHIEL